MSIRIRLALTFLAAFAAFFLPGVAQAATSSLDRTSGTPGSNVVVSGSGYQPLTAGTVGFSGQQAADVFTDSSGNYSATLPAPSSTGSTSVVVKVPEALPFQIKAALEAPALTVDADGKTLTWTIATATADLDRFEVWRDGSTYVTRLNPDVRSYVPALPADGLSHTYRVVAYDAANPTTVYKNSNTVTIQPSQGTTPAPYPSRLKAQGRRIVDSNGYPMKLLSGGSIHVGTESGNYLPSQAFMQQVADRGGKLFRAVLNWRGLQPTSGTSVNSTYLSTLDTFIQQVRNVGGYAMLELHLNVGAVPSWATTGTGETEKWDNHGGYLTRTLAARYGTNPVVVGFGLNEPPLDNATTRNGYNAIPFLESVQSRMIQNFRLYGAPDWVGFVALGYANQTPYPDSPRTPANPDAYDAVGGNVVMDVHDYHMGNTTDVMGDDGRQANGHIAPTWQGGRAKWQVGGVSYAYVDDAIRYSQMTAYLGDYVTYCDAAGMPLMAGEVGWNQRENTGGKAAWWADKRAILREADVAIVLQWILGTSPLTQDTWISAPSGVWDPEVEALLAMGK